MSIDVNADIAKAREDAKKLYKKKKKKVKMNAKNYKKKRFKRAFLRELNRACNEVFGSNVPMIVFCKKYYNKAYQKGDLR